MIPKLSETISTVSYWKLKIKTLLVGKMFSYWGFYIPLWLYQHNQLGNIMKIFNWYHENSLHMWKFCINVMKMSSYCCFYVLERQISHKVPHQIKYKHYIFLTAIFIHKWYIFSKMNCSRIFCDILHPDIHHPQ